MTARLAVGVGGDPVGVSASRAAHAHATIGADSPCDYTALGVFGNGQTTARGWDIWCQPALCEKRSRPKALHPHRHAARPHPSASRLRLFWPQEYPALRRFKVKPRKRWLSSACRCSITDRGRRPQHTSLVEPRGVLPPHRGSLLFDAIVREKWLGLSYCCRL
jgi:hypothetical protein